MTRSEFIRITNWDNYQHYSDRNPPWIKLHVELLDKPKTMALPVPTRWLAICLLLTAARTSNVIPSNIARLAVVANLTHRQTTDGLRDLLQCRFVEPLGKRRAASQLASRPIAEGKPSRARTRSASVSASSEPAGTQELVAHFCDQVAANGDFLPARVKGQTAKEIGKLIREGAPPDVVKRALTMLAAKGKHPSVLPSLVLEAQRPAASNGRRPVLDLDRIAAEVFQA